MEGGRLEHGCWRAFRCRTSPSVSHAMGMLRNLAPRPDLMIPSAIWKGGRGGRGDGFYGSTEVLIIADSFYASAMRHEGRGQTVRLATRDV